MAFNHLTFTLKVCIVIAEHFRMGEIIDQVI